MKAILPLAALLGLFCVTLTSAVNPLEQYCEACLRKSATSGIYPHPNRCDAFVQCDVLEKTFRAYVIMCAPGLYYDDKIGTCNWASAVKCNKGCQQNKPAIKDAFTCNGFYECVNQKLNPNIKYCPNGQQFNELQSRCIPDPNCPPPKKALQCFPHFKLHQSDPNKFYQAAASGWIEQRCAVGTGFNMTTCTCSIVLPVNRKVVCELVKLPLDQNLAEQSHGWFVNHQNVFIVNNEAQFKPDSYLIVPVVTNNDFGDHILISLKFKLSANNFPQNEVAILGNSECEIDPTFTVFVRNVNSFSPELVGKFLLEHKGNEIPVEFKTQINKNAWVSVRLIKKGDNASMEVNDNVVGSEIVPGTVKKQNCALTLGQSYRKGNFTGFMKNVEICKCP